MIRTSLIKTAQPVMKLRLVPGLTAQRGTLILVGSCHRDFAGARQLSTTSVSRNGELTSKLAHQEATEGHKREFAAIVLVISGTYIHVEDIPGTSSHTPSQLTKPDAVSTVPEMVRGDWVLFHPVYSTDELKAVQVCSPCVTIGL